MARPAEKARSMLNKWVKMREEGNAPAVPRRGRRPVLASECHHLADAEHYRNQIIREISVGISKIQNPALGEHTIRDLNDDINKKLREKHHWNRRIKELGGLDFNAIEKQRQIEQGEEGNQALEANGYKYFGAAKDLPGVKELFEKQAQKKQARKRGDIVKNITPEYYGWRDEEDGVLLELEDAADKRRKRRKLDAESAGRIAESNDEATDDYLDVPSQDEIAQILLEEKKKALLAKFSF